MTDPDDLTLGSVLRAVLIGLALASPTLWWLIGEALR